MRSRFEFPETLLLLVLVTVVSIIFSPLQAQTRLGGEIGMKGLPAQAYSAYLPKSFGTRHNLPVVVSFHPLNSLEWNATSWCTRLQSFAEAAQVIVICPDGGSNGQVDDPADITFAKELLESFTRKYNLQGAPVYLHGYSWGTRAAIRFAIRFPERIKGIMLMSSVPEEKESASGLYNLKGIPVYLVQGQQESVHPRLLEFRRLLNENGAFAEVNLIAGCGHEMRAEVFDRALLDSWKWVSLHPGSGGDEVVSASRMQVMKVSSTLELRVVPHPSLHGHALLIVDGDLSSRLRRIDVFNSRGEQVDELLPVKKYADIGRLPSGVYLVVCEVEGYGNMIRKVLIR